MFLAEPANGYQGRLSAMQAAARLAGQVSAAAGIPGQFDLLMETGDVSRACRMEWITGNRVGVSFH